jgi:Right handed beta helix region
VVTVAPSAGADFVTDGTDDNVEIQAAIDAVVAAGGGTVFIKAGTYSLSASLTLTASNVRIIGEGMGVTNLVCAALVIGDTPAIAVGKGATGSDLSLTASTAVGTSSITISPPDAATLHVGDWLLLKSKKQVDSENPSKFAGELHYVTAVDSGTGVVNLNDVILDAYLTSTPDSAQVRKIGMIKNVALKDMSVTSLARCSDLSRGFINFRFVENLQVTRVEMHHAFHSMQLHSCINSRVTDCYIHHINDVKPKNDRDANLRYGIWIAAASQNIAVDGCRFAQCRHSITFGTEGGTDGNGIQRCVTVSNCVSMQTDTSHYDTHEPCDGISFVNCAAIGGRPFGGSGAVVGFQSRGKNVVISGCVIKDIPGRGIMLFNAESTGTIVTGNTITNIKRADGKDGIGIFLDSSGPSRHVITDNVIRDCDSHAISGAGRSRDIVIANNLIDNCPAALSGASVVLSDAQRISITGNTIISNRFNQVSRPVQMADKSDKWTITNNQFYNNGNNNPALVGTNNSVFNNYGVNPQGSHPVGNIAGSAVFDRVNGSVQTATLTGNVDTVTITAGQNVGDKLMLVLAQDANGARTITWPANAKLAGGTLTLSVTANAVDVVGLAWDGTHWCEVSRALCD